MFRAMLRIADTATRRHGDAAKARGHTAAQQVVADGLRLRHADLRCFPRQHSREPRFAKIANGDPRQPPHGYHYDNSPNDPANPDPARAIRWGDKSEEEMMTSWIEYLNPVAESARK